MNEPLKEIDHGPLRLLAVLGETALRAYGTVHSILAEANGLLWFATKRGFVYAVDAKTASTKHRIAVSREVSLQRVRDGVGLLSSTSVAEALAPEVPLFSAQSDERLFGVSRDGQRVLVQQNASKLWRVKDAVKNTVLLELPKDTTKAWLCPDGMHVWSSRGKGITELQLRRVGTRSVLQRVSGFDTVFFAREQSVLTAFNRAPVVVVLRTGTIEHTWKSPQQVLAVSEDGLCVVALEGSTLRVCTIEGDERWRLSAVSLDERRLLSLSPDGRWLALLDYYHTLRVFDLEEKKEWIAHEDAGGPIAALAFTRDERSVLSAQQRQVRKWNIATERTERVWEFASSARRIATSPDGRSFAVAHADGVVRGYDIEGDVERWSFAPMPGSTPLFWSVTYSPDGAVLVVTATTEQSFCWVWDVHERKIRCSLVCAGVAAAPTIAFVNGGRVLLLAGHSKFLRVQLDSGVVAESNVSQDGTALLLVLAPRDASDGTLWGVRMDSTKTQELRRWNRVVDASVLMTETVHALELSQQSLYVFFWDRLSVCSSSTLATEPEG